MYSRRKSTADFIRESSTSVQSSCSSSKNGKSSKENESKNKEKFKDEDSSFEKQEFSSKNKERSKEEEDFKSDSESAPPKGHAEIYANIRNSKNIHIGDKVVVNQTVVVQPSTSPSPSSEAAASASLKNEMNFYDEFKTRLKSQYKRNHAYMRSLFWEEDGYDYSIKDYFVELKVEKGDLMGYWKEGEKIELNKIFSNDEFQTILVTGGPGYGKTTLCKKIAYDWSTKNSSYYLKHFDLVIVITLRELQERNINDTIIGTVFGNSKSKSIDEIKNDNLNFLIILDGYDEMHYKKSVLEFVKSESFNLSSKMTIIVTSRPHFIDDIRKEMEHRLSINGFEKDNQIKYIKLIFKNDENESQSLIEQLNQEKFLSDVAECPLMLHMICCLHHSKILHGIKRMTDLYIKIFSLIVKRFSQKNNQYELKKGSYFSGEDLLIRLGELAWKYLQGTEKITSDNLKKYFSDDEYKIIVGLDILVSSPYINEGKESYLYDPLHRTFFEFLSSLYLYNIKNNVSLKNLFVKLKTIPEPIYIFLCGLYGEKPLPTFFKGIRRQDGRKYDMLFLQKIFTETKENDECFCSFCSPIKRVEFSMISHDINVFKKVINYGKLQEITLLFPSSFHEYEKIRNTLINSKIINIKLSISLYVGYEKSKKYGPYFDIRDSIKAIINFIMQLECRNSKVCLSGFYCVDAQSSRYDYNNYKYLSTIPNEIKRNFDETEAIALEGNNYNSKFLISCEQYEFLRTKELFTAIFNVRSLDSLRNSDEHSFR